VPLAEWPLSIERLVEEERALLTFERNASMSIVEITPEDARRMLGDDDEGVAPA
jgi:hypothetical protein